MKRTFTLHTVETAPEASRSALAATAQKLGFLPNLVREMAEAPATLKGYLALGELLEETSLSPVERQLVLASVSIANPAATTAWPPTAPGYGGSVSLRTSSKRSVSRGRWPMPGWKR